MRTLRHLRFRQMRALVRRRLIGRAADRLAARLPWTRTLRGQTGQVLLRVAPLAVCFPEWEPEHARRVLATRKFRFLNLSFQAETSIPWSGGPLPIQIETPLPKLWFYHLNYCDFLNLDLSRTDDAPLLAYALDIALDWIRSNFCGKPIAWDPYPSSLRVVNWLKFLGRNAGAAEALGRGADVREMVRSIADQARWLSICIEEDLGGNHLIKNAKALLFAGACLECAGSRHWWEQGSALLSRELDEQVLPDGCHVERSPMYHCQVLEDLLDIEALASAAPQPLVCRNEIRSAIARMASFLEAILHPDGEIPLLNDSAFGMTTSPEELLARARPLQLRQPDPPGRSEARIESTRVHGVIEPSFTAAVFADSGYAVLREPGTSSFAVLDCGPLGPDYQPGHGHCDLLSYELSLAGHRVVVDTGVSTYEPGAERLYERSTAAHNTLRIDGQEQAEIWSSFRVGRRPRAGELECGDAQSSLGRLHWVRGRYLAGAHRNVVHTRSIAYAPGNIWLIVDTLDDLGEGIGQRRLESFIHFHPSVAIEPWPTALSAEQGALCSAYVFSFAGERYALFVPKAGSITLGTSWYAPRFGRRERRAMISWTWQGEFPTRFAYAFAPLANAVNQTEDLIAALAGNGVSRLRAPNRRRETATRSTTANQ